MQTEKEELKRYKALMKRPDIKLRNRFPCKSGLYY